MPVKTKVPKSSSGAVPSFEPGQTVLGRLKGYPAWPSRVVDPDNVPPKVERARPSKQPTVYCVQFFPAGDFAWLNARDIIDLPSHQIQAYLQEGHRKKDGELKRAYEIALNPQEWETRQSEWLASQAEQEDELEYDEEEMEEEDGAAAEDDDADAKGKKRKAPKSKGKVEKKKAKVEKKPEPKAKTASKPAKKTTTSKQPESKTAHEEAAGEKDPLADDPVCVKVKDWRHKLQRAFLSKSLPTADDMDSLDEVFQSIEAYKDMTIEALQYSKIGKVMKKIVTLEGIPRNEELKITDRAKKLMDGWTDFIENSQTGENGSAPNGADAPKAEASTSAAPKSDKAGKPKSSKAAKPASSAKGAKKEGDVEVAEAKAEGSGANGNGDVDQGDAAKEESEDKKESDMPGAEAPVEA